VTDGPLVLAVPSKGRLQENASAFFSRAGLKLVQKAGGREYRGTLAGLPGIEVS
jgi:ATP phosphoribosyltransferase